MTDHRIDTLSIHAAAPDTSAAEHFTRAVLDRACDLVEPILRGRTLAIRRLPLRIALEPGDLSNPASINDAADTIAEDVAAALGRFIQDAATTPADDAPIAIFDDHAHRAAIAAAAFARGVQPWFAPEWTDVDGPLRWAAAEPARLLAVLHSLARNNTLEDVLAAADNPTLHTLRASLDTAAAASSQRPHPPASSNTIAAEGSAATTLVPHSRPLTGAHLELINAIDNAIESRGSLAHKATARRSTPQRPAQNHAPVDPSNPSPAQPPTRRSARAAAPTSTNAAGLFYLLLPILELKIGEILWRRQIPEGPTLAAAARLLLPRADDAALTALAGGDTEGTPTLATNPAGDAAAAILRSLRDATARHTSTLPTASRREARIGDLRAIFITADADESIIAVFPAAAPAPDWPTASAHDDASALSDPLLTLDTAETLLTSSEPASLPAAMLTLTIAGTLALYARSRLIAAGDTDPNATLRAALATRGEFLYRHEELTIRIDAEDASLPLRRAGLDRDPGWVPWLQRTLRFDMSQHLEP